MATAMFASSYLQKTTATFWVTPKQGSAFEIIRILTNPTSWRDYAPISEDRMLRPSSNISVISSNMLFSYFLNSLSSTADNAGYHFENFPYSFKTSQARNATGTKVIISSKNPDFPFTTAFKHIAQKASEKTNLYLMSMLKSETGQTLAALNETRSLYMENSLDAPRTFASEIAAIEAQMKRIAVLETKSVSLTPYNSYLLETKKSSTIKLFVLGAAFGIFLATAFCVAWFLLKQAQIHLQAAKRQYEATLEV